jgi:hypothetical protein
MEMTAMMSFLAVTANQFLTYDDHDTIYGGTGNDTITPGWGDDVVDGGTGTDTLVIDYSSLPTQAVAWQEQDQNTGSYDVYVGNAYGIGTPIKTNISVGGNYHVAISADGLTVAGYESLGSYSSGNQGLWVQKIHSSDPAVRVNPLGQGGYPMLSGNGSKVVWSQGDSVWTANADGTQVRQLTNLSGSNEYYFPYGDGDHLATISEDGSTIAWSRRKSTGSYNFTRTILIANIDGTNLRQIDISGGDVQGLDLSADGSKITWSQVGFGSQGGVWIANTDGTNKRELSGNLNETNIKPSISADGSRVVWVSSGSTNLYAANTDGSRLWAVPNTQDAGSVGSSSLSGDGKRVTFSQFVRTDANNIRTWGLYTTSVDGTEPSILVDTISTNYDYGGFAALSSYVDIGVRYNSFDLATGSGEIYTWGPSRIRYSNVERFDITGTRYGDELFGGNLDDKLTGGGGADTLKAGLGNDAYILNPQNAGGSQIEDAGGTDTLQLTGVNLSLGVPTTGTLGMRRAGTSLLIDLNQDGIAVAKTDLTILNFFDATGTVAGTGFIETVANLVGTDILSNLQVSDDTISGSAEDDFIDGWLGNDQLNGATGNDTLRGQDGNDSLNGGEGNDLLQGGNDDDTLAPGWGDDVVDGGAGTDVLVLDYSNLNTRAVAWSILSSTANGQLEEFFISNAYGIGIPLKIGDSNSIVDKFALSADGTTFAYYDWINYNNPANGIWSKNLMAPLLL